MPDPLSPELSFDSYSRLNNYFLLDCYFTVGFVLLKSDHPGFYLPEEKWELFFIS